jgi:peptidoglycan hydrolase-like protein with peptidoglycan-binding domain
MLAFPRFRPRAAASALAIACIAASPATAQSLNDLSRGIATGIGIVKTIEQLSKNSKPANNEQTERRPSRPATATRPPAREPRESKADTSDTDDRDSVMSMQKALADLGHDVGEIDGKAGNATRQAVSDFQKSLGATPTGRLSATQRDELMRKAALASPKPSEKPAPRKSPPEQNEVASTSGSPVPQASSKEEDAQKKSGQSSLAQSDEVSPASRLNILSFFQELDELLFKGLKDDPNFTENWRYTIMLLGAKELAFRRNDIANVQVPEASQLLKSGQEMYESLTQYLRHFPKPQAERITTSIYCIRRAISVVKDVDKLNIEIERKSTMVGMVAVMMKKKTKEEAIPLLTHLFREAFSKAQSDGLCTDYQAASNSERRSFQNQLICDEGINQFVKKHAEAARVVLTAKTNADLTPIRGQMEQQLCADGKSTLARWEKDQCAAVSSAFAKQFEPFLLTVKEACKPKG